MNREDIQKLIDGADTKDLMVADVWHEGTKNYYQAVLLKKRTLEEVLDDGIISQMTSDQKETQ